MIIIIIYEALQRCKLDLDDLQDQTALFTNEKGIIIKLRIFMEKQKPRIICLITFIFIPNLLED